MYVDESGDPGLLSDASLQSASKYFVLSALIVKDVYWGKIFEEIKEFRRELKNKYQLNIRQEIHAGAMMNHKDNAMLKKFKRYERYLILRDYMLFISNLKNVTIINVSVDKTNKTTGYDVFGSAWRALLQRFENTLSHNNFPESNNDYGIIFSDNTHRKLTVITRKMRFFNHIPSKYEGSMGNRPVARILEDPVYHDSKQSYFIQTADVIAYFLYQHYCPNKYIKGQYGHNLFEKLKGVTLKVASKKNEFGIVEL